jgi:hypothetical protein
MPGAKHRHESASDRRTPRPWTFFGVAAGLLARRSASYPVFPMRGRISDVKSGTTHCLQLRGQRRTLARSRDTPASLLATKSCDIAGRDAYMWYYSGQSVNGALEIAGRNFQKNFARTDEKHEELILSPLERRFPRYPGRISSRRRIGREAGPRFVDSQGAANRWERALRTIRPLADLAARADRRRQ